MIESIKPKTIRKIFRRTKEFTVSEKGHTLKIPVFSVAFLSIMTYIPNEREDKKPPSRIIMISRLSVRLTYVNEYLLK